jgi:O-antigen ligase
LAGFFWRYAAFFERGATSVSARLDYWRAAVQIVATHPLFGTGPGTFLIPYEKLKRPESETARLVHNDYLEQASDSGLPGAAIYTLFIGAALVRTFPRRRKSEPRPGGSPAPGADPAKPARDWLGYSVWLGVLGWSLQGLLEFGLYIPALAWTAFALLGWLLGRSPDAGV